MMSSSGSGSVPTVAVGEQLNGLYKLIEDLSATVNVLNNKNISLSVQLQALSIASASSSNSSGGDSSAIALDQEDTGTMYAMGSCLTWLDDHREVLSSALEGWQPPCIILLGAEQTGFRYRYDDIYDT
jgi:hypothetical protein